MFYLPYQMLGGFAASSG